MVQRTRTSVLDVNFCLPDFINCLWVRRSPDFWHYCFPVSFSGQAQGSDTAIPVSQAKPPRRSWTLIAAFIIAAGLIAWFLTVHRHEQAANGTRQALQPVAEPTPHDIGAQKLTKVTVKKYGVSVLLPSDVFPDFEILSTGQGFSLTHDRASLTFYDSDKSLRQTFEDHVAGAAAEVNQNIDYKVLKDTCSSCPEPSDSPEVGKRFMNFMAS
jgi:hypothetical protein